MSLEQFKQDLKPTRNPMREWADASDFFISMRATDDSAKEASFKALGKDLGIGAGVGASIGAIRATGIKQEGETIGGKLKRVGTEAADKAIDGTVQGLAVHGIRHFGSLRNAAGNAVKGMSKVAINWGGLADDAGRLAGNTVRNVGEFGRNQYHNIKRVVGPKLADLGDSVATAVVKNPESAGAVAGGAAGAGLASSLTYNSPEAATASALGGGILGAKFGPQVVQSMMNNHDPLLGHGVRSKLLSKVAFMGAVGKTIGKTLAGNKAAIPLATAGVGFAADKATGGSGVTGALAGGGLGLAGRSGILRSIAKPKGNLLGGSVASGARAEMSAAARAAKPAVTPGAAAAKVPGGSTVANAMPHTNPAVAPMKPAVTPGARPATVSPVQSEPPSLQQLAREAVPQAPNMGKPVVSPMPKSTAGMAELKAPDSMNLTGTEFSSLNTTGIPKTTMTDRVRQSLGNAKAQTQAAYNNRFNRVNFNDPKLNNTLQLVETAQSNPKAMAGIVNNLDQKTVNQLVRMGVI